MTSTQILGCITAIAIVVSLILVIIRTLSEKSFTTIAAGLLRGILSLRYDVEVSGLDDIEKIRDRGTVFLPNHPALIDPVILMSILYKKFRPRSLSKEEQVNKPLVRRVVKLVNPIIIPDVAKAGQSRKRGVLVALREVARSLNNNEEIVIYPSGRLYRSHLENLGGNSGVEYILKKVPETRIILVRITGLWGSSFSHARGIQPSINSSLGRIIAYLFANMIFFGPRRKVKVELIETHALKKLKSRMEINSYLEHFYNETALQNSYVPYYWWQGSVPRGLAEPRVDRDPGSLQTIPTTPQALVIQLQSKDDDNQTHQELTTALR